MELVYPLGFASGNGGAGAQGGQGGGGTGPQAAGYQRKCWRRARRAGMAPSGRTRAQGARGGCTAEAARRPEACEARGGWGRGHRKAPAG